MSNSMTVVLAICIIAIAASAAEAIQRLAGIFADERAKLEHEWSRGDDKVSTEDLRIALRRYRSFFDRLLSVSCP
jgi:hypothetical protein